MWKDARIVMLDAETTGIKTSDGHRIIEVGLCVVENREIKGSWSQLVDPELPALAPKITEITGLTIEDLLGKPKFLGIVDKLRELVDKSFALAAYNASFDEEHYRNEFDKANVELPNRYWLDPLVWVRNYDGSGANKLTEAAARHGVTADGEAHRAKADSLMAAKLMLKLMEKLPDDFNSVIALQDIWKRKQDAEWERKRAKWAKKPSPQT